MEQQPFTSSQGLQISLDRRQQELQQDTSQNQYLIFTSVPQELFDRLCDNQTPTSKFCRFFFNPETGLLIAKLMARPAHELAVRSFDLLVYHELHAMNVHDHLKPFGSTRSTIGNWTKQADCCWSPTSSTDAMPSLVVEVGLSESTRQLALSARHWLETLSSVGIVVTITINRKRPEI